MTINLTKIMGNATDMDKAAASRVYFVPLKDIETNKNNYFTVDDSVEALSLNIRTVGILDPLVAVSKNGTTLLISGERRYRALKLLNEHGDHYSFNGTDITGTAPVCYVKDERQDLLLGAANAHRDMTKEEKNAAIDRDQGTLHQRLPGFQEQGRVWGRNGPKMTESPNGAKRPQTAERPYGAKRSQDDRESLRGQNAPQDGRETLRGKTPPDDRYSDWRSL